MNRKQRCAIEQSQQSSSRRTALVSGATASGLLATSMSLANPAFAATTISSCADFNSRIGSISSNGGTYALNFTGTCLTTGAIQLTTTNATILNGPSTGNLTFDIGNSASYFAILQSGNLTVNRLNFTVSDHHTINDVFDSTYSGALTLGLSHVSIHDVSSTNSGAIYVEGHLNISDSSFFNLNSAYNGSAINLQAGYSEDVTIANSSFHNNGANGSSELGVIDDAGTGTLAITNTSFSHNANNNSGNGNGGVITQRANSHVTIAKSTFTSNSSVNGGAIYTNGGGSIEISHSSFTNNTATTGGAIFNEGGTTLTVDNTEFDSNTATNTSGAIYSEGSLSVRGSTFFENSVPNGTGGAIYVPYNQVAIDNSTFVRNFANDGGAMFSEGGLVSNSTFWNNLSTGSSTAGSIAINGGSLFANILANQAGTPVVEYGVTDLGANLFTDASFTKTTTGAGASKLVTLASLKLKSLALNKSGPANSGTTKTVALDSGSSAINYYSIGSAGISPTYNTVSTIASHDQRGVSRPQDGAYDVGAYESGPKAKPTPNPTASYVGHATVLFHADSARLTAHAKAQLRALAAIVMANKVHIITLDGHTATMTKADPSGRKLRGRISGARTRAVQKYLNKQFKKAGYTVTITRVIKGAANPVKSNRSEAGRKANRRVYITVK